MKYCRKETYKRKSRYINEEKKEREKIKKQTTTEVRNSSFLNLVKSIGRKFSISITQKHIREKVDTETMRRRKESVD